MRRNLQSKFNALGAVLILFAFLLVPMFNQVKADTRGSLKEAKNTWMSKMFREVAKDFKPRPDADTEVEDYWAEQVKQHNEDCRQDPNNPKCDRDGDLDGDGMSNGDEVQQGRNPSCNEEKMGVDYCKGADKYNVTGPDPTKAQPQRILLGYLNWSFGQPAAPETTACIQGIPNLVCSSISKLVVPLNTTLLECYTNATQYTGSNWNFNLRTNPGGNQLCQTSGSFGTQQSMYDSDRRENPDNGTTSASLNGGAVQSGRWETMVWATVVS